MASSAKADHELVVVDRAEHLDPEAPVQVVKASLIAVISSGSRSASSSKNVCETPMQNRTRSGSWSSCGSQPWFAVVAAWSGLHRAGAYRRSRLPIGRARSGGVEPPYLVRNSFFHLVVKYVW